jgi:hypothetical protein
VVAVVIYTTYEWTHQKKNPQEAELFITQTLEICRKDPYIHRCLKKAAQEFVDTIGLSLTQKILKENEKLPDYFATCHQLSHFMGQYAFEKVKSIPKVYAQANGTCVGGVYHGAVEGYFMKKKIMFDGSQETTTKIAQEVKEVCGKKEDQPLVGDFVSCHHGLGHALMYLTDNELPQSLLLCDNIEAGLMYINHCYTGVLMQNYASLNDKDHPSKYVDLKDPLYPCYILEKKYQSTCYSYGVLTNFQSDSEESIRLCGRIPQEYSRECFKTYGRDRTMVTYSPSEIKKQCDLIKNFEYRADCITAAARALVARFGATSNLGVLLCGLQEIIHQPACYLHIIDGSRNYTSKKTELISFCKYIPNTLIQQKCITDTGKQK